MTSLLRADQIATPAGAFFADGASPLGAPLRHPNRAMFGRAHAHPLLTDRAASSVTSATVDTGAVTLAATVLRPETWPLGSRVVIAHTPQIWMDGVLTAVSGTSVSVNVTSVAGAGTYAAWNIRLVDPNATFIEALSGPGGRLVTELDWMAELAGLANAVPFGIAGSFMAQTSGGVDGHGLVAHVWAGGGNGEAGHGAYVQADRANALAGTVTGIEINACQLPGTSPANAGLDPVTNFGRLGRTPYKPFAEGEVVGMRLAAGSDAKAMGRSYWGDAAAVIKDNGAEWIKGLVFMNGALVRERAGLIDNGTDSPDTGFAPAISLAHGYGLEVFSANPSGGAGTPTQEVVYRQSVAINAADVRIWQFVNDAGWSIREWASGGAALFRVDYRADAANNLLAKAGGTGQAAELAAEGADANIPILLKPKGTGRVGIGAVAGLGGLTPTIAGYIEVVDTATGTTHKIPTVTLA